MATGCFKKLFWSCQAIPGAEIREHIVLLEICTGSWPCRAPSARRPDADDADGVMVACLSYR